jgi:shikimate kinase / 3-dehydroquinate synthase
MNLVLYGPPGVGKTTVGRLAAQALAREFVDVDAWLEARWGRPVPDYFAAGEQALFRAREAEACRLLAAQGDLVIAPGGGALLDPHSRAALEATGLIVCLRAAPEVLLQRLAVDGPERPLLAGDPATRLHKLLAERASLYDSFAAQVNTDDCEAEAVAAAVTQRLTAADHVRFELGTSSALIGRGLLQRLPALMQSKGLRPPFIVFTDSHVGPLHGAAVATALEAPLVSFPAGEAHKNLATVAELYRACLAHGLERGGTVVALGGGVVGDVAGFVAATILRGVAWVNLPTTVLAMADASLGGKVGVDLPEGKNLVGAFHPPALIVADTATLATLPPAEVRSGLAEVIKSGAIGDADLFERLERGTIELEPAIARAAAVKVGVVISDPFEHGERAVLNLGHTIGHGVETASGYRLSHGDSIAIGMAAICQLAETLGVAEPGLARRMEACLRRAGLPVRCPGLAPAAIRAAMSADKKKARGQLKFVLPRRIGEVVWGQSVDEAILAQTLEAITHDDPR